MKKLSGFSLMEMMIVLLIVSIIAGATAPIINKKITETASQKTPWVWLGANSKNIGYNILGGDQTVVIGDLSVPSERPSLYIKRDIDNGSHIRLAPSDGYEADIVSGNNSIWFSNKITEKSEINNLKADAVTIGYSALSDVNSVAIGHAATANKNSVAIGRYTNTDEGYGESSVAIGYNAKAAKNSIAIGSLAQGEYQGSFNDYYTNAAGERAISIGYNTRADGNSVVIGSDILPYKKNSDYYDTLNSIAIGHNVFLSTQNSIAIGSYARTCPPILTPILGKETYAIAIGDQAGSKNLNTIAIGNSTNASAENSIAIGSGAGYDFDLVADESYLDDDTDDVSINSIAIGNKALLNKSNTIVIGNSAKSGGQNAIAMGNGAETMSSGSIAIGNDAKAGDNGEKLQKPSGITSNNNLTNPINAIAIGYGAEATNVNSIAIGSQAKAHYANSVAIGNGAEAPRHNIITLGTADHTVYIPGNLVITGNIFKYLYNNSTTASILSKGSDEEETYAKWQHQNNWNATYHMYNSDRRLKNVGEKFKGGLEEIKKLEVFSYTFKKDKSKTPRVGVMAQDLQKIFPDAVIKGEDGFLRIRMEDIFYSLVNAVKELDAKIDSLKDQEIAELKKRISELEKENKVIEKRIAELEKITD